MSALSTATAEADGALSRLAPADEDAAPVEGAAASASASSALKRLNISNTRARLASRSVCSRFMMPRSMCSSSVSRFSASCPSRTSAVSARFIEAAAFLMPTISARVTWYTASSSPSARPSSRPLANSKILTLACSPRSSCWLPIGTKRPGPQARRREPRP